MTFLIHFADQLYTNQIKNLIRTNFPLAKIQTIEKINLETPSSKTEKIYIFVDNLNFKNVSNSIQQMETYKKNVSFIMVSESHEFAIGCIRHSFYDYLLTDSLEQDFRLFSNRLSAQLLLEADSNVKNHIVIKDHKSITKLQYNNIVFIEAYGSYSNLYTYNKFYTISKTIKSIIHNFPESFVRVHRSYAVNLDHVQSFSTDEVIMNNETRIKISRAKKMALLEAIQKTA